MKTKPFQEQLSKLSFILKPEIPNN